MGRSTAKRLQIWDIWRRILRGSPNVSANELIRIARKRGLSYARRQILLADIRGLRVELGLPETREGPYTTYYEAARGGKIGHKHGTPS